MSLEYEAICKLEDISNGLLAVRDIMQVLSEACCETTFQFPKNALILPTFELNEIVNDCDTFLQEILSKRGAA